MFVSSFQFQILKHTVLGQFRHRGYTKGFSVKNEARSHSREKGESRNMCGQAFLCLRPPRHSSSFLPVPGLCPLSVLQGSPSSKPRSRSPPSKGKEAGSSAGSGGLAQVFPWSPEVLSTAPSLVTAGVPPPGTSRRQLLTANL